MNKIIKFLFIIYMLFCIQVSLALDIPKKYIGDWNISYIEQQGFPWWSQIKYPVKLFITPEEIRIIDQYGYKCSVSKYRYDEEIDVLVFSHCGIGQKSKNSFEIMQVMTVDLEGKLQGRVKSYKTFFQWCGEKLK
ncbi:MAG: hypothetical protein C0625_03065 [Arcobacter sp.]|nr:MAG: hypothetical protein C0625_03065 [Arcobacter sp.]